MYHTGSFATVRIIGEKIKPKKIEEVWSNSNFSCWNLIQGFILVMITMISIFIISEKL